MTTASAEEGVYALSEDAKTLTIELQGDISAGYTWQYSLTSNDYLRCAGVEYGLTDAGGVWKAAFTTGYSVGNDTLTLTYLSPSGNVCDGYALDLSALAEDAIAVNNVTRFWHMLDDWRLELTVRLPANETTGYQWSGAIEDNALELLSERYLPDESAADTAGAGGVWEARYRASMDFTGETALTFTYAKGDEIAETRTLRIAVDENEYLTVTE